MQRLIQPRYNGMMQVRCYQSKTKGIDANKDYYMLLNLKPDATEAAIKKNFYDMAKKYHPDSNELNVQGTMKTLYENKFKEITVAYDILMDKSRRETYDSLRRAKMRETEQSNPFAGRQGAHYEGSKRSYSEDGT